MPPSWRDHLPKRVDTTPPAQQKALAIDGKGWREALTPAEGAAGVNWDGLKQMADTTHLAALRPQIEECFKHGMFAPRKIGNALSGEKLTRETFANAINNAMTANRAELVRKGNNLYFESLTQPDKGTTFKTKHALVQAVSLQVALDERLPDVMKELKFYKGIKLEAVLSEVKKGLRSAITREIFPKDKPAEPLMR